jgi:hypothetical protein
MNNLNRYKMNKLKSITRYTLYILLVVVLFTSCNIKIKAKTEQKIGIVTDAGVVATSFNESMKTQVKTKDKFFVVYGLPQINIGDSLIARMDGKAIYEIQDATGKWFRVR